MENSNEKSGKGQLVAFIALILVALLLVAAIVWILLDRSKPQEVPQQSQQTEASSETTKPSEQPTEDPFPTVDFFPGYGDDETEPSEEPDEEEPTQGNTGSSKPFSIFSGEHANLYTGVRFTCAGLSHRNSVTVSMIDGKGANGSTAVAYILSGSDNKKEDSNEMYLKYDVLSGLGYRNATVENPDDVLWFWVASQLSADQLLHVNVNSKNLAADAPVYTLQGDQIIQIPYQADHTKVTAMGPVPYTMDSGDQTYARIKITKGWSGWIGIPASSLAMDSGVTVDNITLRLYGEPDTLRMGDVLYLDEFQVAVKGVKPTVTAGRQVYTTAQYVQNPDLFVPVWKGKWTVPAGLLDFEEKYRQFFDPKGRVLSVAHRGDRNGYYPENSLEGCLSSILAGADIIEVDIAKTKDGHLVLMHDTTITATTNIAQLRAQGLANDLPASDNVIDWTLEQLQRLRLTDDRKSAIVTNCSIPTLKDIIKVCKGRVFITLDKSDRFNWYQDIWPLMQELDAYLTVMVPYNYASKLGYAEVKRMLTDIKNACGRDAIFMGDARSGSLPYAASEMEKAGIPKAFRISEYDPSKYTDFLPYVGTYRIYAETIKAGADVAMWTEMADKGYNIIMGWGDIYTLTKFIAQRHFS